MAPSCKLEAMQTDPNPNTWTESDSQTFLDIADVAVPGRREQMDVLASLVPAQPDDAFLAADLGCGEGLLSRLILERFPRCRLTAFDGSELMRAKAAERLAAFGSRAQVRPFQLPDAAWLADLPSPLRCAVSSLALHHLDDAGKRRLFGDLAARLEPGGALLIADVVASASEVVRRSWAQTWDGIAREQSLALTGASDAYERAVAEGWIPHADAPPAPGEMPSALFDQLKWLEEAGFPTVDCFWMRAGVAVYGGYR